MIKRLFDILLALLLLVVTSPPMLAIIVLIRVTSPGPAVYWSDRVGIDNTIFRMPKFRTMRADTPQVPTHLLKNPERYVTAVGSFLRKYSLDELPQFWSILLGDMSFVGPRPALFNQADLINLRTGKGIHKVKPGITGWAQVNGRDELPIPVKVSYDEFYLKNRSFTLDMKILLMTLFKVLRSEGVTH